MDRLREGTLDARKFLTNIGKQRVCPGEVACGAELFQFAQRSSERFTQAIQYRRGFNQIEIDQLLHLIFLVISNLARAIGTPINSLPPRAENVRRGR